MEKSVQTCGKKWVTKCAATYMLCTLQSMACCLNLPAPKSLHILLTPKEGLKAESTTSTYSTCPELQGPDAAQASGHSQSTNSTKELL